MPLQIYLAERKFHIDEIRENVNRMLKEHGRAIVVVSEGLEVSGWKFLEEYIVRDLRACHAFVE
ncbi:MAG: hypothetical protein R3C12_12470 [Planctomycetaceae bacterium]